MSDEKATKPAVPAGKQTGLTAGGCAFSFVVVALILFGKIAWVHVTVFHSGDVVVVVVAGLLVVEGALLGLVLRRRPDVAARMRQAPWLAWVHAAFFAVFLAISLPAGLILWLNQSLDRTPGTTRTLLVGEKWVHSYKGNSRDCRVSVPADVPRHPPIVFPWSGETEPVILPCSSYAAIVPGQSRVTLAVHPGAFGLPWYDRASLAP